jgi:two-component system, OmpR family, sensor histidine kinase KdpD
MTSDMKRPTPEELLRRAEAEERQQHRGRLKVFLGYASGVGKSFRMVDEGRRRKLRGQDVVVGAVQPDTGQDVVPLLEGFEVIPFRRDLGVPCLDLPAIVRRRPGVCLIDGLAYRNPPGAESAVERIRGKQVADAVPESFLRGAEDIEVVDAPPEYCLHRAQAGDSGNITVMERQLSELREIALLLAAEVVEAQLDAYLKRHGIEHTYGTQERVLICVTPRSNAELMIVRGRRQADRFHGDLHVVYVEQHELSDSDRTALDRHLEYARRTQAHVEILRGDDLVRTLLDYSCRHGITQIFVGHSQRKGFWQRFVRNPVERLIAESSGIDVRVFPNTTPFEVD